MLAAAILVLGAGLVERRPTRAAVPVAQGLVSSAIAGAGSLISLAALIALAPRSHPTVDLLGGTFVLDYYAIFFQAILVVFAIVTILLSYRFAERFKPHHSEFVALVLLATVGGMFMASAREMIQLYVALETLSISLYVMVAFNKREQLSSEAGFKYLIVGAASSAVLLYGLAILYGLTGRTDLTQVARIVAAGKVSTPGLVVAMLFVIGGLSFKIAAVPFHQWVPDVYQGAPTPVTAFIAVSSKTAGYALLIRVLTSALLPMSQQWGPYLAAIAAATMTIGNVTALSQTSVKRLLGYSSIAHAGYIVMGVVAVAGSSSTRSLALGALLFYLLVYGLTNFAAFGAVEAVEESVGSDDLSALSGLGERSGGLALVLSLAMLSLTGIPPLIGFFAKFFIFYAAVQAGYAWLALIAVANSALSAVYYLKVVRAMYLEERPARAAPGPVTVGGPLWAALGLGVVAILPLIVFVSPFVNLARDGADAIFH